MANDTITQTLADPATRDQINKLADRLGVKPSRVLETLIQGHGIAALATYFPRVDVLNDVPRNDGGIVLLSDDQVLKIANAIINSATPIFKAEISAISRSAINKAIFDYLNMG